MFELHNKFNKNGSACGIAVIVTEWCGLFEMEMYRFWLCLLTLYIIWLYVVTIVKQPIKC